MGYDFIYEKRDCSRINKLNKLNNPNTFWDDVRKLTKRITSDHSIERWQSLAECRYKELFFEPRPRTALDGKTWWCVWDNRKSTWSTLLSHGRYKTRFECNVAIYNTIMQVDLYTNCVIITIALQFEKRGAIWN